MAESLDVLNIAVSLLIRTVLLAARFSGWARKRSLKRLAAIDHFSRKVVCVVPLEGPNAGCIIEALEQAMQKYGAIAVTEWVIKTLKYECLKRVPLIKGFDHLTSLCTEFEGWYNAWRPHMTLKGLRPDDLYYSRQREKPKRHAKTVPGNIERHVFAETRLTTYRLKNAA